MSESSRTTVETQEAAELFGRLFSAAPPGQYIELRNMRKGAAAVYVYLDPRDPHLPSGSLLEDGDWYFGACLRAGDRKDAPVTTGTVVWLDVDSSSEPPEPHQLTPRPTAVVASGKGWHAYWALTTALPAEEVRRLVVLACATFDGDRQTRDIQRLMRLPGSLNHKYARKPRARVHWLNQQGYAAADLQDELLAAFVARAYPDAASWHGLAMGLAALLLRAHYEPERAERVMRQVCRLTSDGELEDRLAAVRGTFKRQAAGTRVSAGDLRAGLGDDDYRLLLDCLGVTSHDGDLLREDVVVGHMTSLEQDLVALFVAGGEWAVAEGTLVRWDGNRWRRATSEEMMAGVFDLMLGLKVVQVGEERPLTGSSRLARDVAPLVRGYLERDPLAEPDAHLLPLANGVLDLRTGELGPADPLVRNRWVMPVALDPAAGCPTWLRFLAEAAPATTGLLQEWFGYCLVSGNRWQRMLWLYGPSGTGKSQVLNVLAGILGEACTTINSGRLEAYEIAGLAGMRVATCSELSTRTLRTTLLKAVVAGDGVAARYPYGRPFTVRFHGKLVWASNSLPPVDEGEGLWRRVVVVPFNHVPAAPDPLLGDKLEGELAGVLNWALEGLARMREHEAASSWDLPDDVTAIVKEYREAADIFALFAQEELVLDADAVVSASAIYARYAFWSKERGHQAEPFGPLFWRELRRLGLEPEKTTRRVDNRVVRLWRGATIATGVF